MATSMSRKISLSFAKNVSLKQAWKLAVSKQSCRCLSVALHQATQRDHKPTTPIAICRTSKSNPAEHTEAHEGLFYTLPPQEAKKYQLRGMRLDYGKLAKSFTENTLMVRQPALEVMSYLKAASYTQPAIRYILYGRDGAGKTCSMAHVMHYCGTQGWLILHVPWAANWGKNMKKDAQLSMFRPGRIDQPLEAAEWLANFKLLNEDFLKTHNPVVEHTYTWTKREETAAGTPWLPMIDFGLDRVKYASDIVGAIIKEVRHQSSLGRFKTLVAVDGVNGFNHKTKIKREENRHQRYHSSEITLISQFKKILRNDWSGGAILCSVDIWGNPADLRYSYMPKYLLQKEGFELFDPHIPINVPNYSDKEINSCLEYYIDRHWIQNPKGLTPEGRKEIIFLSSHNPQALFEVTRSW